MNSYGIKIKIAKGIILYKGNDEKCVLKSSTKQQLQTYNWEIKPSSLTYRELKSKFVIIYIICSKIYGFFLVNDNYNYNTRRRRRRHR